MADIPESTKMEVTRTSRGFAVSRGVDRYAAPYSIQDSSLAEEAAIWLGSDADTGGRAHLTQDMAAGLIPLLQAFVATGSIASRADTVAAPPAMDREAVEKLVQPWADYHGDLPDYDHPLRPVYESGVEYVVQLLAKELGVEEWDRCDGTEEFDGDLGGTLMNIVLAAMPKDKDGDPINPRAILSTLSADALRQGEGVACRFGGVEYSRSDLAIAQRAACAIVPLYGTGDHGEQDAAQKGKLWNDHPAVQGALRALHEARLAAVPQTTGTSTELAALDAIDRFVTDHVGNDDTSDGIEVDERAQKAVAVLRAMLATPASHASDGGKA